MQASLHSAQLTGRSTRVVTTSRRNAVAVCALFRPSAPVTTKEKQELKKLNKLATKQKQEDADLLAAARSGKTGEDGRMTREQYYALRRKIGGTARDYFKDYIQPDVKTAYMKPTEDTNVPGLAFLVVVLVAVLGTTGYIVTAL